MTQVERIATELQTSLGGDAWHGESVLELLNGVTDAQADARPIPGGHSMHEIILHLTTWVELALRALHGSAIPEWPFPEDWPAVANLSWSEAVRRLVSGTEALVSEARGLSEERLEEQVPGRQYTYGYLLLGIVQHAAYHGGQIALLKRLTRV